MTYFDKHIARRSINAVPSTEKGHELSDRLELNQDSITAIVFRLRTQAQPNATPVINLASVVAQYLTDQIIQTYVVRSRPDQDWPYMQKERDKKMLLARMAFQSLPAGTMVPVSSKFSAELSMYDDNDFCIATTSSTGADAAKLVLTAGQQGLYIDYEPDTVVTLMDESYHIPLKPNPDQAGRLVVAPFALDVILPPDIS